MILPSDLAVTKRKKYKFKDRAVVYIINLSRFISEVFEKICEHPLQMNERRHGLSLGCGAGQMVNDLKRNSN